MAAIELVDTTDYLSPRLAALTHALEVVQKGLSDRQLTFEDKQAYCQTEAVILDAIQRTINGEYPCEGLD